MNKTLIIIQREFLTRVKSKAFILLTIFIPFIFAAIIVVPVWLASIKDDGQRTVNVVDKTGRYAALFTDTESFHFVPMAADSASFYGEDSGVEAVVVITDNLATNPQAVSIGASKAVAADLLAYVSALLNEQVRLDKLAAYSIPGLDHIITDVQDGFSIRTVIRNDEGRESASDTDVAMVAGLFLTILIYMFVIRTGALVMQSVMEEKTNRIVELMVSSVRPFQLMMGKIVGIALVAFTQLCIWGVMLGVILAVCSVFFGADVNVAAANPAFASGAMAMPQVPPSEGADIMAAIMNLPFTEMALMFVLYFIGGYLLYASIFAAIGASVNAQEDTSQFMIPIMLVMAFALYAGLYSVQNTDGPLAFWCSLIPFTSPVVMMVRIPFGVPWWQEVLSLTVLFSTSLLLVWLSGRIYRVGILLYGKKPSFREMLRWLRYK